MDTNEIRLYNLWASLVKSAYVEYLIAAFLEETGASPQECEKHIDQETGAEWIERGGIREGAIGTDLLEDRERMAYLVARFRESCSQPASEVAVYLRMNEHKAWVEYGPRPSYAGE